MNACNVLLASLKFFRLALLLRQQQIGGSARRCSGILVDDALVFRNGVSRGQCLGRRRIAVIDIELIPDITNCRENKDEKPGQELCLVTEPEENGINRRVA